MFNIFMFCLQILVLRQKLKKGLIIQQRRDKCWKKGEKYSNSRLLLATSS